MSDSELLKAARLALRMVAERYCLGDGGALLSCGVPAHMTVIGVLEKTGDAERFEIREHHSGQEIVVHQGVRLKPLGKDDADMQPAINWAARQGDRGAMTEMTEARAREILGERIQPNGSLYSIANYVKAGGDEATLDGVFSLDELEAIVWWLRNRATPPAPA